MHSESHTERYGFTCLHCGHAWAHDFEVRHVEDGRGHEHDYYLRDGLPVVNPTTYGGLSCPTCGAQWLSPTVQPAETTTS